MPNILPDSRAAQARNVVRGPLGNYVPTFCANCGLRGADVSESCTFLFWLCNDCYAQHGVIAGTMVVPDEEFVDEMIQEQAATKLREEG